MKAFKVFGAALLGLCLAGFLAACACSPIEEEKSEPEKKETLEVTEETVKEPYYVLVVGQDSRTGTVEIDKPEYADGTGRSDTIMLVRIDEEQGEVALISVPRDTKAELNGAVVKINEIYRQQGARALADEVEALTGTKIKYSLSMSFVQFEKFIDSIGGVSANVPINMSLVDIVGGDKVSLTAGEQELNGPQALVLSRTRKAYANDLDACRQIQNRQLVERGIQKVMDNPAQAALSAQALVDNIETDWPAAELIESITTFVTKADAVKFTLATGPYSGDIDDSAGGIWLATRDEETWAKLISAVENGEDPNAIVPLPNVAAAQ